MLNPRLHAQRGQTIIEWAVFMPVLIGLMLTLIFFSRLGVLSERSQSAVRYGETVSFKNGNPYSVATVEALIDEVLHVNSNELGPICLEPTGVSSTPGNTVPPELEPITSVVNGATGTTPTSQPTSSANRVAADTQAALVQAQLPTGATVAALPSAKPFWRPDHILGSNCSPASISLSGSTTYGVGNLPISVQTVSIASSLNIPSYLSFLMNGETSASMGFLNVATPNTLLTCVPGLSIALAVLNPATSGQTTPACPGLPTAVTRGS